MDDPTDQPAQQADPDCDDQLVRLDLGGWISGPCLTAEEMGLPANWLPEPSRDWPADWRQGPAE